MAKTSQTHMTSLTFRLGSDLAGAMARLQLRDGIPPSEQARRALAEWLSKKGVLPPWFGDERRLKAPKRSAKANSRRQGGA